MKKLYIIRGVPGAGKTTEARRLSRHVFEADDYFMRDGVYQFVQEEISIAHNHCRRRVKNAMSTGVSPIAVANVFAYHHEMAAYHRLAETYGYTVREITVDPQLSAEILAVRNVHGVPVERIQAMIDRWES